MSTAAGADAVPPEATACWCCGTSYPELFLLHLNGRPDAVACLRCGEFLGRRARKPSRRADPPPWRAIRATIRAWHPARERDQLATRGIRLGIRFPSAGSHPLGPDSDLRHDRRVARATRIPGVRVHDVITLSSSTHRWATPPGTPSRPSSASVTPTHLPVVSHGVVQHPPERRTIRDSRWLSSTADLTYVHTRHHLSLLRGSQDKTRRMISPQPARLRSPSAGRRAKVAGRGTGRKDDYG